MLFTANPEDRVFEKLMTAVPNFQRPSCGLFIREEVSPVITGSYSELVFRTVRHIQNRDFSERFQNHMKDRGYQSMKFRNQKHESLFRNEARKPRNQSARILTALYLFTADHSLWVRAKHCICQGTLTPDEITLAGISLPGYTLYNTVLTLCCNNDKISISDLADKDTISPMLFDLICEAMTLRRYGMTALLSSEKEMAMKRTNSEMANTAISGGKTI